MGFPKSLPFGSDGKASACNAGDLGLIPESERSPGDGNGNSLQYSCLENSRDRGSWLAIVHGLAKNQIYLSNTFTWSIQSFVSAAAAAAKSLQSCPTLCDPIDGSPPGSPVPGILQARTLEWVAISFSNA